MTTMLFNVDRANINIPKGFKAYLDAYEEFNLACMRFENKILELTNAGRKPDFNKWFREACEVLEDKYAAPCLHLGEIFTEQELQEALSLGRQLGIDYATLRAGRPELIAACEAGRI